MDTERRSHVIQDLRRLLAGTFLADAPICPLSNVTGEGYEGFFESLNQVVSACGDRPCAGLFRVWVEDVFTIRGSGTVITGIPTSGAMRVGSRLHLLPGGVSGHVRRMQVYGEDATEARAGECVALNIPEIDHQAVRRGMILCESDLLAPVSMAEVELRILDSVKGRVEDYIEAHLHVGTASTTARLAMLEATEMTGGQKQMVQLRLTDPLPLVPGERFVVRSNVAATASTQSSLTTIGGGRILGTSNVRLRRKKQWTLDALAARREAIDDPGQWCELMLRESARPTTATELQQKCLLRTEEMATLVERLRADGRAVATTAGAWLHHEIIQKTASAVLATVQAFHSAHPQQAGAGREELLASLKADAELLDMAVESLLQTRQIERHGTLLARAGWSAQVSDREQRLCDQMIAKLKQAAWAPPSREELAAALGESPQRVGALAQLLVARVVVVQLEERVWMHHDAVEAGKQVALKLFTGAPIFSTMEFRDALGVSRKYAVPLLDYLDKTRFTVRSGHHRTPGAEARKLLP